MKILVVCGPTATGKTGLAALLAKKFNGELISADSRQVYRGMDLETAKERPDVPIWLYDVMSPGEEFSVSHWVKLAKRAIFDIQKRHTLPIVVGGTGLYIKALLQPFETIDIPPNRKLRKKLQKVSVKELQSLVRRGDMNDSDWNNPRRLIRKIEIGRKKKPVEKQEFDAFILGLTAPLPELYRRIDKRIEDRLHKGMMGDAAIFAKEERSIARKQMTWFKKQEDIEWVDVSVPGFEKKAVQKVERWYTGKSDEG